MESTAKKTTKEQPGSKAASKHNRAVNNEVKKRFTLENVKPDTFKEWYRLMLLGRKLDDKAPNYLKQALGWSYHAPYAGHDAIQLAMGQVFNRDTDHLFPYYRDMLTAISAGLTAEEILLNGLSKATDVASGGRHMSNHFAKPEWNIHNVSSATGNHTLHAVGVARGMKRYGHKGWPSVRRESHRFRRVMCMRPSTVRATRSFR